MNNKTENIDAERAALLPCPFCGGPAELRKTPNMWMVECNNAECGSNPDALAVFKHDVIAAWNRRTPSASIGENGLHELPEPDHSLDCGMQPFYRPDQMRQYARDAVAADRRRWGNPAAWMVDFKRAPNGTPDRAFYWKYEPMVSAHVSAGDAVVPLYAAPPLSSEQQAAPPPDPDCSQVHPDSALPSRR